MKLLQLTQLCICVQATVLSAASQESGADQDTLPGQMLVRVHLTETGSSTTGVTAPAAAPQPSALLAAIPVAMLSCSGTCCAELLGVHTRAVGMDEAKTTTWNERFVLPVIKTGVGHIVASGAKAKPAPPTHLHHMTDHAMAPMPM